MDSSALVGRFARRVIADLQAELQQQDVVGSILATYIEFCKTDDARRLGIVQSALTDEVNLRLTFEGLCFSAFYCSLFAHRTGKKQPITLSQIPNQQVVKGFDGALATSLLDACQGAGYFALREISLVAFEPRLLFGFGEQLNPIRRLQEYLEAFVRQSGNETEWFGKLIGKSLDAPIYPLIEPIGLSHAPLLVSLAERVINTRLDPTKL